MIEYDLVAQLALFKDIGHALQHGAAVVRDSLLAMLRLWPLGLAVVGAILAILFRRRRRDPQMTGGPAQRPRTRSPVAQAYEASLRLLAKAGHAKEPATTPREHADRLARTGGPAAPEVRELTELYYAAEWGGLRDPEAERRAGELAIAIKTHLRALPR